jgi:RNA-binding protein PNO1
MAPYVLPVSLAACASACAAVVTARRCCLAHAHKPRTTLSHVHVSSFLPVLLPALRQRTTQQHTQSGKTKYTIENATKTRIVLADTRIHILGSFQNIKVARDALCSLILGSPAGKVYSKLRSVCSRLGDS